MGVSRKRLRPGGYAGGPFANGRECGRLATSTRTSAYADEVCATVTTGGASIAADRTATAGAQQQAPRQVHECWPWCSAGVPCSCDACAAWAE